MDADWITSPSARRVLQHADDSRPAWLWSQDGHTLLWHNDAAELFLTKLKKSGLKRSAAAVPIKGQVARSIRLGSIGRSSLARVQFLAGDKPATSTCATTPLLWQNDEPALLVVAVDPIDAEILAIVAHEQNAAGGVSEATVVPAETESTAIEVQSEPLSEAAAAHDAVHLEAVSVETPVQIEHEAVAEDVSVEDETPDVEPTPILETVVEAEAEAEAEDAVPAATEEINTEAAEPATVEGLIAADDEHAYQRELDNWRAAETDSAGEAQSVADDAAVTETTPIERADDAAAFVSDADTAPPPKPLATVSRLSALVDRLAADEALYAPLTAADDVVQSSVTPLFGEADDAEPDEDGVVEAETPATDAAAPDKPNEAEIANAVAELTPRPPDPEVVERASRYNFDELSRILNDRVGESAQPQVPEAARSGGGALVNLGGETLVLNRLPLGILVFRDQQVLFANRAITEMVGYPSVESLREAGLGAVFPAADAEGHNAGPVNHLVQRDGTLVPVTARLQSISWQGRPALMLSASTTEVRTGHEGAVRAFAEAFAGVRGDGFFDANRAGVINTISIKAARLLGDDVAKLSGRPLTGIVAEHDLAALREFLERPARFAETARPCLTLRTDGNRAEIILFAQGQAGIVTGYFGFVRPNEGLPARLAGPTDADPALLGRISRGVRRPLNTIIGFSDIIRSAAFGALGNERYETYAQDITTAGQEIAALVDELDDYARLRDGRYLPQRASIELTSLLENCVMRIRTQAGHARVIVRNAISESLPRVTADRASLAQAVLNLLASAIDQTPTGGAVVISAQLEDDGGIAVHVRDSSTTPVDMAERFVVFRDGVGRDGKVMAPVRSSVGLALTRSLLAVNTFSLSVDPAGEHGMLFSLHIPADLVDHASAAKARE